MVQNWHDGLLDSASNVCGTRGKDSVGIAASGDKFSRFEAAVGSETNLGFCSYHQNERRLVLMNRSVAIERRALLMGFSQKAKHRDVIGAFGEGMKVGALALLRKGLRMSIGTHGELWHFVLAEDPCFGERVLSVEICPLPVSEEERTDIGLAELDLQPEDTFTMIDGLEYSEWVALAPRFLFLCPPNDSFKMAQGRLLLDEELKGKMFVKGIFINDLTQERLRSGADFFDIRLDRDRAAVLKMSDIDHQVSSMWARAILLRPDLLQRYYEILSSHKQSSDITFADLYCDEEVADIIAAEFYRVNGAGAVPVKAADANKYAAKLAQLSRVIDCTTVVCSDALLAVLGKSGAVQTDLGQLFQQGELQAKQYVPQAELTQKEISCLAHICAILASDMETNVLDLAHIDVVEFSGGIQANDHRCWLVNAADQKGRRIEVSRAMLDPLVVHNKLPQTVCLTPELSDNCKCCEAELAQQMCKEWYGDIDRHHNRVFAHLLVQSCGLARPACEAVHHVPAGPTLLGDREQAFRDRIQSLEIDLASEREKHARETSKLHQELQSIKKEVAQHEFQIMDVHEAVQAQVRQEFSQILTEERESLAAMKQTLHESTARHESEIAWLRRQLDDVQGALSSEQEAARRRSEDTLSQLRRLQTALARRRELLQAFLSNSKFETEQGKGDLLAAIQAVQEHLQEEASQNLCCVCVDAPPNIVLLPCRHKQLCLLCAKNVVRCPICRSTISERMEVYES